MFRTAHSRRAAFASALVLFAAALLAMPAGGPVSASSGWTLDIDRAMDAVGVAPGMVIGEAGAGDGYFTLPMARRVGPAGVIYANDISSRSLNTLADRSQREGLGNIHTVVGEVADPRFPRRDLELVVVVHAFHDFDKPVEWLANLKGYLRPGGTVAIIDLDPDQGAESHFWPRARIEGYAAQAGYEQVRAVTDVSKHLILVFRPRAT
jgi:ubiquinone/menaquinone biosynthesis C-methylase UbiE